MKITEFIRRKNAILFDITGITLVPEDQIEEVETKPLSNSWPNGELCPYCKMYAQPGDYNIDCSQCIMSKRCNECNNPASTYQQVVYALKSAGMVIRFNAIPEIMALTSEYNEQFIKRS